MISDDRLEEIRAQADITQIVGEYVSLRRSGRTYRGPCPLHGGDGPNFSIDPDRGIFKCFVCGEGGDVFAFPMKLLGLEFIEAVKFVAERSGIVLPEIDVYKPEEDPYRDIREAIAYAADWFQHQLWDEKSGAAARRYMLEKRGLPEEAVRRFGLGVAPDSWRSLREAAAVHEMSDDLLLRAGLIKQSERAKEPYDLFRGRLIFPIYDLRDRPIGFGGRTLSASADAPKYINSPESPIFHKGRIVYGLNWSRNSIRREDLVIVVEGFTDLVALVARGLENVIAPLGTALTDHQAALLRRYAKKALLLYDSDRAGQRATFRAADVLLAVGIHPTVATLPSGEDPDSITLKGGVEALATYTDAAIDVLDRKIQILAERDYFDAVDKKRQAVDLLLPTVKATADETLSDIYLDRIAERTGVRKATLERELERTPATGRRARRKPTVKRAELTPDEIPRLGAERKLLLLLVRDRSLVSGVSERVEPDDFRTSDYREIYCELIRSMTDAPPGGDEGDGRASLDWAEHLPGALYERVCELAADPEELTNPQAVLEDAIARLEARKLQQRLIELMDEVLVADTSAALDLASEIQKVRQELSALGNQLPGRGLFGSESR